MAQKRAQKVQMFVHPSHPLQSYPYINTKDTEPLRFGLAIKGSLRLQYTSNKTILFVNSVSM